MDPYRMRDMFFAGLEEIRQAQRPKAEPTPPKPEPRRGVGVPLIDFLADRLSDHLTMALGSSGPVYYYLACRHGSSREIFEPVIAEFCQTADWTLRPLGSRPGYYIPREAEWVYEIDRPDKPSLKIYIVFPNDYLIDCRVKVAIENHDAL